MKAKFKLRRKPRTCPRLDLPVDELVLCYWEASVDNKQHLEIIKLARMGLWTRRNSRAIADALALSCGELSPERAQAIQNAIMTKPKEIK